MWIFSRGGGNVAPLYMVVLDELPKIIGWIFESLIL